MTRTLALLAALSTLSISAQAQSNWNRTDIGQFQFYNGQVNNQPLTGTGTTIDNFTFFHGQIGDHPVQCTTTQVGEFAFTNCN